MTSINKGDFIELDYTGMLSETKIVFDTTEEKAAKENGIHTAKTEYGSIIICVGQHHVVPGLDEQLVGKDVDKDYSIQLPAEKAFGKKDARLVQMIPMNKFTKEGINPVPGLQINVDNAVGTVKHAGGGRVLVDFNHPLAGQDVTYTVHVKKLITDDALKFNALLQLEFRTKDWNVAVQDGVATISSSKHKLPAEIQEPLSKHVHEVIPSINKVVIALTATTTA